MKTKSEKSFPSWNDIISYIQGNLRYKAYYSKNFKWLIRDHIREQIDFRIKVMDKECYDNGSCKLCGCSTTALQMADKACDKPCYPPMMCKTKWDAIKELLISTYEKNKDLYNILLMDYSEL